MPGGFIMPSSSGGMIDSYYSAGPMIDDTILNRSNWAYLRRSVQNTLDITAWTSLWPRSANMGSDGTTPMIFGNGQEGGDYFEPPSAVGFGTQSTKFLKGTTFDSTSAVLAGAIVQGFVTVTDIFVGQVTSNSDGTFILPTANLASVQHYVVAYKSGSPDVAGTSSNTLLPTNIDGS